MAGKEGGGRGKLRGRMNSKDNQQSDYSVFFLLYSFTKEGQTLSITMIKETPVGMK